MHSLESYPRRGISSGPIDCQRNLKRDGLRRHTQRGTGRARSRYRRREGQSARDMRRPLPSGLHNISNRDRLRCFGPKL